MPLLCRRVISNVESASAWMPPDRVERAVITLLNILRVQIQTGPKKSRLLVEVDVSRRNVVGSGLSRLLVEVDVSRRNVVGSGLSALPCTWLCFVGYGNVVGRWLCFVGYGIVVGSGLSALPCRWLCCVGWCFVGWCNVVGSGLSANPLTWVLNWAPGARAGSLRPWTRRLGRQRWRRQRARHRQTATQNTNTARFLSIK